MKHSLVVVDDFHPEPMALREAVLASEFKTEVGPDGATYAGISQYEDTSVFERLAEAMHHPVIPRLSCWRLNYKDELPHNFCHADVCCSASWAALLYLHTPEQCAANSSGTAFFTHKPLGLDHLPTDDRLRALGANPERFKAEMEKEWLRDDVWGMNGFVGMKFNRLVAYPTAQFHSRWPHEGFGTTKADARLILACFFDFAP